MKDRKKLRIFCVLFSFVLTLSPPAGVGEEAQ